MFLAMSKTFLENFGVLSHNTYKCLIVIAYVDMVDIIEII